MQCVGGEPHQYKGPGADGLSCVNCRYVRSGRARQKQRRKAGKKKRIEDAADVAKAAKDAEKDAEVADLKLHQV